MSVDPRLSMRSTLSSRKWLWGISGEFKRSIQMLHSHEPKLKQNLKTYFPAKPLSVHTTFKDTKINQIKGKNINNCPSQSQTQVSTPVLDKWTRRRSWLMLDTPVPVRVIYKTIFSICNNIITRVTIGQWLQHLPTYKIPNYVLYYLLNHLTESSQPSLRSPDKLSCHPG